MRKPARLPAALAAATVLAACGSTPPPPVAGDPGVVLPEAWSTATTAAGPAADGPWWQAFAEPRLDALIAEGLQHNRDLQQALARLEAASAQSRLAGAPTWPEVDAGLDAQRARRLFLGFPFGSSAVPSSTTTTFSLSLGVRWELDLWGRVRAGTAAALADRQAAAADLHAAQLSLVGQICRTWFAAVEARQQLELAEATVAAFRATAADVRDRFRRGVRPALDVHLAASDLAAAEAAVAQRRDTLQRATRALEVLAGRYPSGLAATGVELPRTLPPVPGMLPGDLLHRRPDLVAAERRLAAAGCRVDAARAALWPRLSLTASGGTTSTELEDLVEDDFRVWSLGANLLAPLFRGGALRSELLRQQALRAEALAAYGGAVLRAFAEVEDVLAADALLDERRAALAAAAHHAAQARDLARQRYQLGLTDFLAVADGQRQAFLAGSTLIAVDRARLDNRIDLFLALGGGFDAAGAPAGATP